MQHGFFRIMQVQILRDLIFLWICNDTKMKQIFLITHHTWPTNLKAGFFSKSSAELTLRNRGRIFLSTRGSKGFLGTSQIRREYLGNMYWIGDCSSFGGNGDSPDFLLKLKGRYCTFWRNFLHLRHKFVVTYIFSNQFDPTYKFWKK